MRNSSRNALKTPAPSPDVENDSLFQSAFDYAAIGIALVAPDGKWLKVNRAICDITGYTETELLSGTFQDITHPEDLNLDLSNVAKMLAGEIDTYQMEKRYLHKNGDDVWVLLSVSLVRESDGAPRFFISQLQDVTSRKKNEKRLDEATAEIRKLQRNLIKICAWTKRIQVEGRWISIDDFLRDHLRLKLTHGISIEGARMLREE